MCLHMQNRLRKKTGQLQIEFSTYVMRCPRIGGSKHLFHVDTKYLRKYGLFLPEFIDS